MQGKRIVEHPILDTMPEKKKITIYFNGQPLIAYEGDTVAAALTAHGVRVFRHTIKKHEPRGVFCAIGHCTDCVMTVNGVPGVKTCIAKVQEGMRVDRED